MKTALALGLALVLALAIHEFQAPQRTLDGLRQAIHAGDAAQLEERVDFESLRTSMKSELHESLLSNAAEEFETNPVGAIAMGVASLIVDPLVEWTVTPSGLAHLAAGEIPMPDTPIPRGPDRRPPDPDDLFPNARIERERLHRFSVWVPGEIDETRWVFRRESFGWRLTSIELPNEN